MNQSNEEPECEHEFEANTFCVKCGTQIHDCTNVQLVSSERNVDPSFADVVVRMAAGLAANPALVPSNKHETTSIFSEDIASGAIELAEALESALAEKATEQAEQGDALAGNNGQRASVCITNNIKGPCIYSAPGLPDLETDGDSIVEITMRGEKPVSWRTVKREQKTP